MIRKTCNCCSETPNPACEVCHGNVTYLAPDPDDYLWSADPNCEHELKHPIGGGVNCIKCHGWFCY